MTGEELFELLGGLDEKLIDGAEKTPKKRKNGYIAAFVSIAAVAALLALVLFPARVKMGSGIADSDGANFSNAPEAPGDAPDTETGASGAGENSAPEPSGMWLDAVVVETDGQLVVAPAEDSPYYGVAERFILTMTDAAPDDIPDGLAPGDRVRVECDMDSIKERGDGSYEIPTVWEICLWDGE